jgi:hypothetical protein
MYKALLLVCPTVKEKPQKMRQSVKNESERNWKEYSVALIWDALPKFAWWDWKKKILMTAGLSNEI